jgi:hypothetical protein
LFEHVLVYLRDLGKDPSEDELMCWPHRKVCRCDNGDAIWEEPGIFDRFHDWILETASGFSEAGSDISIPYDDYIDSHGEAFYASEAGYAFVVAVGERFFPECKECQALWFREWDALVHPGIADAVRHPKVREKHHCKRARSYRKALGYKGF